MGAHLVGVASKQMSQVNFNIYPTTDGIVLRSIVCRLFLMRLAVGTTRRMIIDYRHTLHRMPYFGFSLIRLIGQMNS